MRKKFNAALGLALILSLVMLALAACSSSDGDQTEGQNAAGSSSAQVLATDSTNSDKGTNDQTADSTDAAAGDNPLENMGGDSDWDVTGEGDEWLWGSDDTSVKGSSGTEEETASDSSAAVEAARLKAENAKVSYTYSNSDTDLTLAFAEDGTYAFGEESTFYTKNITLTITAPEGALIYYTLDGTTPDSDDTQYTGPITFAAKGGSTPNCYILRVRVLYKNDWSRTAARSYFVGKKLDGRFSTLIFSITGDPADLTEAPDGILYGDNYEDRGRESEREVYVEAWEPDGTSILAQFAGARVYGGYSRQSSIKSLKLFSRKSYDPDNKNFKFSEFGTLKLDGSDKVIKSYDKLVLRNCGNDLQFSYIRDELSQTLCKKAGFECYEAVLPAVAYLNGSYYNLYWLHENYCDKYFKEKYGDDAPGEFVILEGGEQEKNDDEDCQDQVDEYNDTYNKLIKLDLTNDANYRLVTDFMDVESYLDFFAWNIAINNWDWPNNNFKCFKYIAAADDTYSEGVFDGRWRYLVHDMDYTYNLYDQDKAMANYNTLKEILNPSSTRYAPLFDLLMDREDCRQYFKDKTYEYINGVLSEESIKTTYYELHATRVQELSYYYDYMKQRARKGDFTIWTDESHYSNYENQILTFAEQRAGYVAKYMEAILP